MQSELPVALTVENLELLRVIGGLIAGGLVGFGLGAHKRFRSGVVVGTTSTAAFVLVVGIGAQVIDARVVNLSLRFMFDEDFASGAIVAVVMATCWHVSQATEEGSPHAIEE